jgi:hypothetical protein
MDSISVHALAGYLTVLGAAGTVSMLVYRAALRYADLDHGPVRSLPRLRWWTRHAVGALAVSLVILACGLLGLLLG